LTAQARQTVSDCSLIAGSTREHDLFLALVWWGEADMATGGSVDNEALRPCRILNLLPQCRAAPTS